MMRKLVLATAALASVHFGTVRVAPVAPVH